MSNRVSKRMLRPLGALLAALIILDGGCSGRPRTPTLRRPSSTGFARVNGADTTRRGDDASSQSKRSTGAVSNTATTLEVPIDGESDPETAGSITISVDEPDGDTSLAAEATDQPAEKAADSPNPLRRLMIWKSDPPAKPQANDDGADANVAEVSSGDPTATDTDDVDEPKQTLRSRSQRLLSLLRFPWGNEEGEPAGDAAAAGDEVSLDDASSEPDDTAGLSEEAYDEEPVFGEEELAGGEPASVDVTGNVPEKLPPLRGPQPWSQSDPSMAPTGVSNQAITTLAEFNEDESSERSAQVAGDNTAETKTVPPGQSPLPQRPMGVRNQAPVEALRRAIFPETPPVAGDPEDVVKPVATVNQTPVEVVKIPNRLSAPQVRGVTKPWSSKLADNNVFLLGAVAVVAVLFGWGLWRRFRAREEM